MIRWLFIARQATHLLAKQHSGKTYVRGNLFFFFLTLKSHPRFFGRGDIEALPPRVGYSLFAFLSTLSRFRRRPFTCSVCRYHAAELVCSFLAFSLLLAGATAGLLLVPFVGPLRTSIPWVKQTGRRGVSPRLVQTIILVCFLGGFRQL